MPWFVSIYGLGLNIKIIHGNCNNVDVMKERLEMPTHDEIPAVAIAIYLAFLNMLLFRQRLS